jgi:TPR repeat protein
MLLLQACSPMSAVTTTPAVMVGVYDEMGKRETWLQRAQAGDAYSQYELAESYFSSTSQGKTNVHEAAKWFCEAAKKGNPDAIIELGKLFEGTKKAKFLNTNLQNDSAALAQVKINKTKALAMYFLADWRASLEGSELRKNLQPQLNNQQIEAAKNYAYYFEYHNCSRILLE